MPIRILIADDHAVVRQGLSMFLSFDEEFEVIGEAQNGREAIDLAMELRPDVILMDLLMPYMTGIEAIPIIRDALPDTEIIALTSVLDNGKVIDALRAGAIGYLLKDTQFQSMIQSIKSAAAGQVQLSSEVATMLANEILLPDIPVPLSTYEIDILRLIALGYSNQDICQQLSLSDMTVKIHVRHILSKLNLASRTQAAIYAMRIGLVTMREL